MALHLVLGTAGSGKTTFLYDEVIRMAGANPATTYYFIVPEQFSIKTQYDLVARHPEGGILNIDVTSLARLADMAFGVLHGEKCEFLPEIGKSMIIKKVLSDKKDELVMFGRNARRAGFVAEAKALISELMQYNVSLEELETLAKETDDAILKNKLEDTITLYSGFNERLGNGLHTAEGLYDAFAEVADRSGVLKKSVVILDGFTGFTPSQYELLRCFMKQCDDVYISFTADETAASGKELKDFDLFRMSQLSVKKVRELAVSAGCELADDVFVKYDDPVKHASVKALERGLFRQGRSRGSSAGRIMLYNASDPGAEARHAASEIERLLREENYRYKDIAVVVSDMDAYGELVSRELDKVNVRYFVDRKKSLGENECSGLITLMLRLMEKGPDTDLLISFAKNSLSGIDRAEACELENYCLALGIKGSRFKKKFEKDFNCHGQILLAEKAEPVRAKIMQVLTPLFCIKTSEVIYITNRVRDFFGKIRLEEKLLERAERLKDKGDMLRAKEYSKVYEAVDDILNQLCEYLGGEEMSLKEYREVLEAGLAEARVGLVPEGSEQIVIGDVERTRLKDIKALFLLGANDGRLPKAASSKGILSEYDKDALMEKGVELSPGMLRKVGRDRFYIYLALSKPTDRLYVSYCMTNEAGESSKASQVVTRIQKLFDDLEVTTFQQLPKAARILENNLGHSEKLREEREKTAKKDVVSPTVTEHISKETADALYGEKLYGSISKLEAYANCPFRFFLTYGLNLNKREEFTLEADDFGNVCHEALEIYGKMLKERGISWFAVSEEERRKLVAQCTENAVSAYNNGIFESSGKNKYISERVEQLLNASVDALTKQLAGSDFEPYEFEHQFTVKNELFTLTGKIDRIDVCRKEGAESVKVIDYKSSDHDFDVQKLYYGQSLQLPVYMDRALSMKELGNVRPAAMLYNHFLDPVVDAPEYGIDETEARETIASEIAKEFKTKGLVNSDFEIIKCLDHAFVDEAGTLKDKVKSERIPVGTKADGGFDQYSRVASDEDFKLYLTIASEKMKKEAREIKAGNVSVTPVFDKDGLSGCRFCDFKDVCGFDLKNGYKSRFLKNYGKEELEKKLKGIVPAEKEGQNG